MIHYIPTGNIFKLPDVTSWAHGCNCAGAMGKRIALQFRNKFPAMFSIYHRMCLDGHFNPGDIYAYEYAPGCFVYNLATQKHYAIRSQLAKLEYIDASVRKTMEHAVKHGVKSIGLPKICAGLGGLNWNDVKEVLEKIGAEYPDIDLCVVEKYVP